MNTCSGTAKTYISPAVVTCSIPACSILAEALHLTPPLPTTVRKEVSDPLITSPMRVPSEHWEVFRRYPHWELFRRDQWIVIERYSDASSGSDTSLVPQPLWNAWRLALGITIARHSIPRGHYHQPGARTTSAGVSDGYVLVKF